MDMTEQEKQSALRCIEEGRPLPDKYRFLLFEDNKPVELIWPGKTTEVTNIVLPFQTIEVVDEPRTEKPSRTKSGSAKDQIGFFDERGRQMAGWTNKLIWGDNKLILSSLKNGPLRQEIESAGGLKLIYIDPPFDVGADFSMQVEVGNEDFLTKKPNVLEELAYRDTWEKGADSFIAMIYERLSLMRDLLANDGSIYVHCDWRVNSYIRLAMDEIFGKQNFQRSIASSTGWALGFKTSTSNWIKQHEIILYYTKEHKTKIFNKQFKPYEVDYSARSKEDPDGRLWVDQSLGTISENKLAILKSQNRVYQTSTGNWRKKQYLDEMKGEIIGDIWTDINPINSQAKENLRYPTQKPEALLQRIIKASSNEGDLVADFFCGSGTTLAVAEKLGRKWIGSDLGKFAIHTSRKRLINVQRDLKTKGQNFRAFEILNLGKYERQHYIGINMSLREKDQQKQLVQKEKNYVNLIVKAYKAQKVQGFKTFVAKKRGRLVAIGPVNLPASRLFISELIKEAQQKQISKVDVLAFEFEMGLFPKIQQDAKDKGISLALKYIPREVFDKQAVEKNQVQFHDVSYIEINPHVKNNSMAVELTDFSVYYNQDMMDNIAQSLKKGKNQVIVEQGHIVKISKDKHGIVSREVLTKKWTDWIDYWAVDFDFESKKEIIRIKNDQGQFIEKWTGDYIFENEWQSFRTKKDRSIELKSAFHKCQKKGRRKIAVKVVDIFGNDTMKVIEVQI